MTDIDLETIYQAARESFPYPLDSTGCAYGDFEMDDGCMEYGEEFTFEAGKLLNDVLVAGGWLEMRLDDLDTQPTISALFRLAQNGDWGKGLILKDELAVQAQYNIELKKWHIFLDTI